MRCIWLSYFVVDEREIWSDDEKDDFYINDCQQVEEQESPPSSPHEASTHSGPNVLTQWLLAFFLLLQANFRIADRVMNFIFAFMKIFFLVIGRAYAPCASVAVDLPASFYMAKKSYTGFQNVKFQKMPVCKQCGAVWDFSECIERQGVQTKPKLCTTLLLGRRRQRCRGILLKTVELATKRTIFYPLMTYCYLNLSVSLQSLLLDPAFTTECALWKTRQASECLMDVYDGRVWKRFVDYNGSSFLSDDHAYGLMINIDWFQPYKHLTYSVGAIYLSVFNLPRKSRYKLQNICLVGIMPGPCEPELTVNQYIDPLVEELGKFWTGLELEVRSGSSVQRKLVRCAILCCSCDLPAGRKLCGFLGHSAHLGCSKCKKYFPSSTHGLDYSGFQRDKWVKRTNESHRSDVAKLSYCRTKTELRKKESELGCRYSSLLKLPYFDPPTMLVIDPMHCLFLGLAKHFIKKVFVGKGILAQTDFDILQNRVSNLSVPSDIGRIPNKIQRNFYSFTADQFKNWVLHYSVICLHGLLSTAYLECWRHLVLACRYLCQHTLQQNDVIIADALLLQYCKRAEQLVGKDFITPNMHMSCHLRECVLDYGPLNHFWLFAFERFNGVLGQLPNNNRSIETQMMQRFISDTQIMRIPLPSEYQDDFKPLLSFQKKFVGTVGSEEVNVDDLQVPHGAKVSVFNYSEVDEVKRVILSLHPTCTELEVCSTYTKYSTIRIKGTVYGSHKSRVKNTSIVIGQLHSESHPARIEYFAKVTAVIDGTSVSVMMVCLSWFKSRPDKDVCGKPVTIWECDVFDTCTISPISIIESRTVSLVDKLSDVAGSVLFVSPYL